MRTQCEAEAMHRSAAGKMRTIAYVGVGVAAAGNVVTKVGLPVTIASLAWSGGWLIFGAYVDTRAEAFAKGCRREHQEQGRRDAAAAANGTAGSGTSGHQHGVEHGQHRTCQSVYITTGAPATTNASGDIVLTGGRFSTFCTPVVLDLDGDGIEYIPISSGIYTSEEGNGRWEQRAWLSPDDGMLFYDENGDGVGTHHETILTDFVEGAATDLEALRAFDGNKDGVIDANDPLYASLKVGRDFNGNGVFEANEVFSLAQTGVARIDLYDGVQTVNQPLYATEKAPGVVEFNTGRFVRTDGTTAAFADVGLEERPFAALAHSGATASVVSYGGMNAWVQTGSAGVAVNLATAGYAGFYNFVDFIGNDGNDYVAGSEAANVIVGGGGADTLLGHGGDDVISADSADLYGGWVEGGAGYDALLYDGTAGFMLDAFSRSFEAVDGGSGDDILWVSSSTPGEGVLFMGEAGNDYLAGGAGDDFLVGGAGSDILLAGDGNDGVFADWDDANYGYMHGGAGYDVVTFQTDTGFSFDAYARGFEVVYGGGGNDYLSSSSTDYLGDGEVLYGHGGDDTIVGGGGNDFLVGGLGSDSISGGHGNDIVVIDRNDWLGGISGGSGSTGWGDSLIFDDTTNLGIASLWAMGFEAVTGGAGNDIIYASRTDSLYYLEKADNFLAGGAGDDFLYGGAGQDVYTWSPGDGNDVFYDRDYGEYQGDVVHLGEGVAAGEVTIRNVGGVHSIHVSGVGAGSMQLTGFAAQYGAVDKLVVEGVAYDLRWLLTTAGQYGHEGILLSTRLPASYGEGGGGYPPPPPPPPPMGGGGPGGGGGGGGYIPPVILDLDGDGFDLIAAKKSGVYFDWDGDGQREQTGWAGPDDGFLVFDRDGDGQITRADEIAFGVVGGKKDPFMSDLEGLRGFDSNGNGSLDAGDSAFSLFGVWRDLDSDAVVDPGELQSLHAVGLTALSLEGYRTGDKMKPNENFIYATTNAIVGDRTIDVADVFLSYDDHSSQGPGAGQAVSPEALWVAVAIA